VAGAGSPVERVRSRGQTRTERVLSLVLLGDSLSLYLAVLNGWTRHQLPASKTSSALA
jgi:hypothetical protein